MKHFSPIQYRTQGLKQSFIAPQVEQPGTIKKVPHLSSSMAPYQFSPQKLKQSYTQEDAQIYRQRCVELENQLNIMQNDVKKSQIIQFKSNNLEEKVAELAYQNSQLQDQLDRTMKTAAQRKNESETWKSKFEAQMAQLIQIKSNYELEIKAMSHQIQTISAKIGSSELEKNRHLSDHKAILDSKAYSQIENIKKSQSDLYENQVKKMRDIIEDKTVQVSQLTSMLERQRSEAADMQARLKSDVDATKNRLSSVQIDHQRELEFLKSKLELQKDTQVKNAQQAHFSQSDLLLSEIEKLRNLLEIKNQEIESLIQQNQRIKHTSQTEQTNLRLELEDLKSHFLQNENTHQEENHNIQISIETLHKNEILSLRLQNESLTQSLNNEINQLKDIINSKNIEIQKQIVEKAQQKDFYDTEQAMLLNKIDEQKQRNAILESEKNRQLSDLYERMERQNQQNIDLQNEMEKQIQLFDYEIQNMKELLSHKNDEIDRNLNSFSQLKGDFETLIRNQKEEIETLKMKCYETEKHKSQHIQDLQLYIKDQETSAKERQKQLEIQNEHQQYEITKVNDMYNNKCKENENIISQKDHLEVIVRRTQDENDQLRNRLNDFEKLKNQSMNDLQNQMDAGASYLFENLKKAYNTQVQILKDQIADLEQQLRSKNKDYSELIERYSILDKQLLPESVVKMNMYNSRLGVPAEYIVNKAIHETLIKSNIRSNSLNRF